VAQNEVTTFAVTNALGDDVTCTWTLVERCTEAPESTRIDVLPATVNQSINQ